MQPGCGQGRVIFAGVALGGRDVADTALPVLDVVRLREAGHPGAHRVEVDKAFVRKLRAVPGAAKHRLGKALSPLTGREHEGLTPNQFSIDNTVVALRVEHVVAVQYRFVRQ